MANLLISNAENPKSVAVFSHEEIIGDGLYKIPVLRALRAAFPQAEVTWITTRGTVLANRLAPLTQGLVDEFREHSGVGETIFDVLKRPAIRDGFDVIIDTQTVVWRSLALRRIPHKVFVSPAAKFRLSDAKPRAGRAKPAHMVDRLIELIELVAGPVPKARPPIRLPTDIEDAARRALPDGARHVALAPGAGKRIKCWPLDHFIAVARELERDGYSPAFVIGPDETEWIAPLREAVPAALFPEQADVWDGGFSPLRTIAIARRCAAAVANDAGVSHMFGAADIPLLTLYGPTDAEKFRPKVTNGRVLRAQDFGSEEMRAIPVEAVTRELHALLAD